MSIRQQIVDAIKARLSDISIANGYSFDMTAAKVTEWRDTPIQEDVDTHGIDIRDVQASRTSQDDDEQQWQLVTELEFFEIGDLSPSQVRQKVQDITTALSTLDEEDFVQGAYLEDVEIDVARLKKRRISAVLITLIVHYYAEEWEI